MVLCNYRWTNRVVCQTISVTSVASGTIPVQSMFWHVHSRATMQVPAMRGAIVTSGWTSSQPNWLILLTQRNGVISGEVIILCKPWQWSNNIKFLICTKSIYEIKPMKPCKGKHTCTWAEQIDTARRQDQCLLQQQMRKGNLCSFLLHKGN